MYLICLGYCFLKYKSCINIVILGLFNGGRVWGKGEKNVKGIEDCVCFEYRLMVKWSFLVERGFLICVWWFGSGDLLFK